MLERHIDGAFKINGQKGGWKGESPKISLCSRHSSIYFIRLKWRRKQAVTWCAVQPVLQSKGDPRTMREKSCVLDDQTRPKSNGHPPRAACVYPFVDDARAYSRAFTSRSIWSRRNISGEERVIRYKRYFMIEIA